MTRLIHAHGRAVLLFAVLARLVLAVPGAEATEPPFTFAVKEDRFIGGPEGVLVFAEDAVEFEPAGRSEARRWTYLDLKQVRVLSPTAIALDTYEARRRFGFHRGRSVSFELREGAIEPGFVAFLLRRIDRPVMTAVLPPLPDRPEMALPVHHEERGPGSDGELLLYPEGLAYRTDRPGHSRYWRFGDLESVLQLDRYRLQIAAVEQRLEPRSFTFTLKTDLAPGAYETLWHRVNPAAPWREPRAGALAALDADRPGPPR